MGIIQALFMKPALQFVMLGEGPLLCFLLGEGPRLCIMLGEGPRLCNMLGNGAPGNGKQCSFPVQLYNTFSTLCTLCVYLIAVCSPHIYV